MNPPVEDTVAWTALLDARGKARQIFWRMADKTDPYTHRFGELLGDLERLTERSDWATLRPHLAAATALCGALMGTGDEDAEIRSTTVTGRLQYMVVNTKGLTQAFVFGDTPAQAVAAFLRRHAGPEPVTP